MWIAYGLSAAVTLAWVVYVSLTGQWGRVLEHVEAAAAMVFGSFVAGSTPQGGGAIAFPVFTKMLMVPGDAARSFALIIQAVGMTAASAHIVLDRRRLDWRALLLVGGSASLGFLVGLVVLADPAEPFWAARIPGPFVRVTFTILLGAMAAMIWLGMRSPARQVRPAVPRDNRRVVAALVLAGFVGGIVSSLVGSGADVLTYLAVVILLDVDPKIGVPTSVVVMTLISILGLVVLGVGDGQLAVEPSTDGRGVVAVSHQWVGDVAPGEDVEVAFLGPVDGPRPDRPPIPLVRFDVFGLWLAALPVVVWGAPLGALFVARITRRGVVVFVALLALAELVSTLALVTELYSDPALALYGLGGLLVATGGMWLLARHRRRLLHLPDVDLATSVTPRTAELSASWARDGLRR